MTQSLIAIRDARGVLDAAKQAHSAAAAAAADQQDKAARLAARVEEIKATLLCERIAAERDQTRDVSVTIADRHSAELDEAAAATVAAELGSAVESALRSVAAAEKRYDEAVRAYAEEVEKLAIADIQVSLEWLAWRCAQAIAAAKLMEEHGSRRARHSVDLTDMFGSAGKLVAQLRCLEWPSYPSVINPGPFECQRVREAPSTLPGVDDAYAELNANIAREPTR